VRQSKASTMPMIRAKYGMFSPLGRPGPLPSYFSVVDAARLT